MKQGDKNAKKEIKQELNKVKKALKEKERELVKLRAEM